MNLCDVAGDRRAERDQWRVETAVGAVAGKVERGNESAAVHAEHSCCSIR
ncbi:hypothetical protein LPW11_14395 [Geomonas sp. RF6]|nr:hypothetical protein [Geomonas sp. RF6]UFS69081.1 hypothetical protein LPW11_14395 [Geomonas sp. RF6]